jgi:aspartyl protease family protein
MRGIVVFAGVVLALSVVGARLADRFGRDAATPVSAASAAMPVPAAPAGGPNSVIIAPDARGHFQVDGRVDGRRIGFMVDTGASVIALRAGDAAMLGIHPVPRDFSAEVRTANGSVRAAPTRLNMVEIGGLMMRDVAALVLPDEALSENLLGLSFLARLRRFEFSNGKLVLEQ